MLILALESSTTSAKAMLYDTESKASQLVTKEYSPEVNDTITQDADGIFMETIQLGRQICEGRDVDAIALSGIWHSLLLCDKDMKPKTRILGWADTRAADISNRFRRDKKWSDEFYHTSGCLVAANYPYFKLLHYKEQGYPIEDCYIFGQGSYITYRLTGKRIVTDCMASGSGLFNIKDKKYDAKRLQEIGITEDQLCKVVTYKDTAPLSEEGAKLLGLKAGIPVIPACADGALNQVGAGALEEGAMTFSVGTSAAIRLSVESPKIPKEPSTWCYLSPTKWLSGAATSGSCNCTDWFNDYFYNLDYKEIEKYGRHDLETPVFLPFLFGERSPGWDSDKRGAFLAIEPFHRKAHMYQAIQEGILFNVYQNYKVLCELNGKPKKILLSGGILHSKFWTQMCVDIFGAEMEIPSFLQSSLMGAVILAMDYLGVIPSARHFPFEQGKILQPDLSKAQVYEEKYHKYLYWYNKISN